MNQSDAVGMLAGFDPLHYLPNLAALPSDAPAASAPVASGPGSAVPSDVKSGLNAIAGASLSGASSGSAPSFWSFVYQLFTDPTTALKNVGLLALLVIFGILFVVGGAYILVKDGGE